MRPASAPARWRLARLLAAPHRLAFAAAALLLAGAGLWWAGLLLAELQGHAPRWRLPPASVHGLVMALGCMPLFFTGFLFTAGPRWLARPGPAAAELAAPVLAQLCGWLLFLLAAHGARDAALARVLGAAGLGAAACGWSGVLWRFARLLRASVAAERGHARALLAAGAVGALCLWGAAATLLLGEFALLRGLTRLALWGFVGAMFAIALHRMLPIFGAAWPRLEARRPWALPTAALALCAVEALDTALLWPGVLGGIELVASAGALALAWRWARLQNLGLRLPAMLWVGWAWLALALLLNGCSHVLQALGDAGLGLAPLHAYTMGFLGSCLLATASRVSSGHAGRPVAADDFVWRLFWVLQLAALARVSAALAADAALAPALLAAAALGWAGVGLAWALRHGRWWGLPRADGRPG